MLFLLILSEPPDRAACADYFALYGCDVDSAPDVQTARAMVRFRRYDAIVTDLDSRDDAIAGIVAHACKRSPDVVPVTLTSEEVPAGHWGMLTKPVRLARILEEVRSQRELVHDRSSFDQSS